MNPDFLRAAVEAADRAALPPHYRDPRALPDTHYEVCSRCEGLGTILVSPRLDLPDHEEDCPKCRGRCVTEINR